MSAQVLSSPPRTSPAQVSLSDKRSLHLDPERQRLVQQQVMLDYRRQPSQVTTVILIPMIVTSTVITNFLIIRHLLIKVTHQSLR